MRSAELTTAQVRPYAPLYSVAHRAAAGISQPTWTQELLVRPSQGASGHARENAGVRFWWAVRLSSFGNPGVGRTLLSGGPVMAALAR